MLEFDVKPTLGFDVGPIFIFINLQRWTDVESWLEIKNRYPSKHNISRQITTSKNDVG